MRILFLFLLAIPAVFAGAETTPAKKEMNVKAFWLNSTFQPGNKIYFHCDAVESRVTQLLEMMGATDVQATCTGGIDEHRPNWDAHLTLSYQTLRSASDQDQEVVAEWRPVSLDSLDNCFLDLQLFNQVKTSFELREVRGTNRCAFHNSGFHVKLSTLFVAEQED